MNLLKDAVILGRKLARTPKDMNYELGTALETEIMTDIKILSPRLLLCHNKGDIALANCNLLLYALYSYRAKK